MAQHPYLPGTLVVLPGRRYQIGMIIDTCEWHSSLPISRKFIDYNVFIENKIIAYSCYRNTNYIIAPL